MGGLDAVLRMLTRLVAPAEAPLDLPDGGQCLSGDSPAGSLPSRHRLIFVYFLYQKFKAARPGGALANCPTPVEDSDGTASDTYVPTFRMMTPVSKCESALRIRDHDEP
jgi:hypothetical protein